MQLMCRCVCNKAQANESGPEEAARRHCKQLRFRNMPGLLSTIRVQFLALWMLKPDCHQPSRFSPKTSQLVWLTIVNRRQTSSHIHEIYITCLCRIKATDKCPSQLSVCLINQSPHIHMIVIHLSRKVLFFLSRKIGPSCNI